MENAVAEWYKDPDIRKAVELGLYVEDVDEGSTMRPVLLPEGVCGRISKETQLVCHKKGTVMGVARDYEDNRSAEHLTCKDHKSCSVVNKEGKVTEDVEYSHLVPCLYWEKTLNDGETWQACESG